VQQTGAAICGAIVASLLGHDAWPMVAAIALVGCMTLFLWFVTRDVRRKKKSA